jgi:hypothetical protein
MTKKAHEEKGKKAAVKQKGNHVHNFIKVVCVCTNFS